MKYLIVVDMQNDFIDAALGTAEAVAIIPAVQAKIAEYRQNGDTIIFTRDTHDENYLQTQEGAKLPVPHCLKDSAGWQISQKLEVLPTDLIIDKPTFGSVKLAEYLAAQSDVEAIEVIGLCTDICVISNAMVLKATLPEVPITVDAKCCAGVTPQSHQTALSAMTMCQINIINN